MFLIQISFNLIAKLSHHCFSDKFGRESAAPVADIMFLMIVSVAACLMCFPLQCWNAPLPFVKILAAAQGRFPIFSPYYNSSLAISMMNSPPQARFFLRLLTSNTTKKCFQMSTPCEMIYFPLMNVIVLNSKFPKCSWKNFVLNTKFLNTKF